VLRVEFTIEPFVDGAPGPHVTLAVAAVEALGVRVDFGPFGSVCTLADADAPRAVAALLDAAYGHGATVVCLTTTRVDA
jgi:hypothetical protein